jgi:RHS repeat-associated protein
VTGTGTLSVPLATSPGRSGFGPTLTLEYDSGAGNGVFGFGWSLSLPSVTRKTDKGLPRYRDEPEDTFILSGAEDLVPVLEERAGRWQRAATRRSVDGSEYTVERYRPRIEGLFARIERWIELGTGETHWRSITSDNVTTVYGKSAESRIADPHNPTRMFSWLICESYDDTGNAIVYEYKAENSDGVDPALAHEATRTTRGRSANRYPKRIRYGNRVSRLVEPDMSQAEWLFEVVFDYGEHDPDDPTPQEARPWSCRCDPFSSYRAGFEVRTYRLCQRVLMFHHFPEEEGVGSDCLVSSTDLGYREDPVASFVESVTQRGYRRRPGGGYLRRSLPPLELTYSQAVIDERLHIVDPGSVENLPYGLDGTTYRWVDLDGEGISGILTEQAGAWFYKPALGEARFGPIQLVGAKPAQAGLASGRQELLDLAGDGRLDLVDFGGQTPGFFERTDQQAWEPFRTFASRPDIRWDDPGVRFTDLTGSGLADVLVGQDGELTWYPSLAEDGFGAARRTWHTPGEEGGPQFVVADRTQAVYLADMSGDGLPDVVRVRNGEVAYWPSLGYGRFGPRVVMDTAPWFDEPDQFDPHRVRVADVDGSGPNDLVYLHRDGVRIYVNRSGNGWSRPRSLAHRFPSVDSAAQVTAVDLLGNGTACLVWSSPLPAEAGRPMRYVDLMGGTKPHLLIAARNNLGMETHVSYAPSTQFWLADKAAGRPWVTRLPFPVQVVERVETVDRVSRNRFVTSYAYHHGYFDGAEREFRGFGLVERYDTERFAALSGRGEAANVDAATHLPPVLTRTWFHTGASADRERISRHLAHEYHREAGARPDELLLPDTVLPHSVRRRGREPVPWRLSPRELREACRALKGSVLREEVYARDGGAAQGRPYTVSERNYTIELLQPAATDHAVVSVHPRETVTAHYERALYPVAGERRADPRVRHDLVLAVDDYGNVLRSVSVGYGRRHPDADPELTPADHERQRRTHLVATDNRYTNPVEQDDAYRTPQPCETRAFEVLGLTPDARRSGSTNLFGAEELARKLYAVAHELPYERLDTDPGSLAAPARRLIEHGRTLYRRDDLTGPLPLGALEPMGLRLVDYRLAFTPGLLDELYGDRVDEATLAEVGGYVHDDGSWWVPSGRQLYSPDAGDGPEEELAHARRHFFLASRFRDPFGAITTVTHDPYDLVAQRTTDALDNVVTAGVRDLGGELTANGIDYRVLKPRLLMDANRNLSEVAFDALGMVVGTAVRGKPEEDLGDSLAGFDPDPDDADVAAYLRDPLAAPQRLLADATTRIVHDLFAYWRTRDAAQPQPVPVATLARETHRSDQVDGQPTRVQHGFSYSDGFGREIQRKVQAEPGPLSDGGPAFARRWVGTGWTVFNNKGKPVRRYEPFFSATHAYEAAVLAGVSPVLFYDPLERLVATLRPNDVWDKVVFDPWQTATWDVNDTVLADPRADADVGGYVSQYLAGTGGWRGWYERRAGGELGPAERLAAERTAEHAGTPTLAWLDPLGRIFLTVAHNRVERVDTRAATRRDLDVEGNERAVTDALGRTIARHGYDMLGNRLLQTSMEAGERLLLNDVTGRPTHTWNSRGFRFRTEYDALRRPLHSFVQGGELGDELLHERTEYGEGQPDELRRNLRTEVFRRCDAGGVVTNEAYDFKGNLLESSRRLAGEYRHALDWAGQVPLEERAYLSRTRYDALDRPVAVTAPDGSVVYPTYNEANLLERVEASLRGADAATVFVADLDYNARGQRTLCVHGNGVRTEYAYDPLTFRLARLRTVRGGEPLQDLGYVHDPVGNVVHIRDDAQQAVFFRNRRVDPSADYTYDALYRLVEATGREHLGQVAGGSPVPTSRTDAPRAGLAHPGDGNALGRYAERYLYDVVGNFLRVTHRGADPASPGWTRAYGYAEPSLLEPDRASNRLTSVSDPGDEAPQRFTYDQHGNTTSMPELACLRWNHREQLQATARQAVGNGGTPETTWYVYDPAGRRVRKVTERYAGPGEAPARKAERVYLDGFEIHREFGGDGEVALERETLHVMDQQRRVVLVETRTHGRDLGPAQLQRYQHGDHLDSVTLELDGDARVISYEEYHPYGSTAYQAVRARTGAPKRYRHAAKERDEESGLAYHGARYRTPWLGRWVSCDPAGLVDGTDLYVYARGNPVRLADPSGTQAAEPSSNQLSTPLLDHRPLLERIADRWVGTLVLRVDPSLLPAPQPKLFPPPVSLPPPGLWPPAPIPPAPPKSGPSFSLGLPWTAEKGPLKFSTELISTDLSLKLGRDSLALTYKTGGELSLGFRTPLSSTSLSYDPSEQALSLRGQATSGGEHPERRLTFAANTKGKVEIGVGVSAFEVGFTREQTDKQEKLGGYLSWGGPPTPVFSPGAKSDVVPELSSKVQPAGQAVGALLPQLPGTLREVASDPLRVMDVKKRLDPQIDVVTKGATALKPLAGTPAPAKGFDLRLRLDVTSTRPVITGPTPTGDLRFILGVQLIY